MKLWVGLSLYGLVLALLAFLSGRFGRDPIGVAVLGAFFGTNLVLLDQNVPAGPRLWPCLATGGVAGAVVLVWRLGKASRQ
jgi:hypothetical protein